MFVSMVLIFLGLICIVAGIRFHLGYFRAPIAYWTIYTSAVYATVPLGASLLFLGISVLFPAPNFLGEILFWIALLWLIPIVVLGTFMPQFATPWWFRYLREEYDEWFILHILMKDAVKDYSGWKERTKTMEGLASWAEDVRQRTRIVGEPDYDPRKKQAGLERRVTEVQRKHGLLAEPLDIVRFRIKSGHKHSSWHPQVGDLAMWDRQSLADGSHSGIKATVIDTNEKRVKIEFMEDGQLQTRVIHPKYLIPIEAVEPARNLIPATRHPRIR